MIGLWQRVGHAMAAFRRGFPLPLPEQGNGGFLVNLGLNNLDTGPLSTKSDQLDSYVGWVYAAVGKSSSDLRANPRAVWRKQGKRREDWEELPWSGLPPIFHKPNTKPNQDSWGKFIELRNVHKDITGESIWHFITQEPGGRPFGLELIQPDFLDEPRFNAEHTEIEGWWVTVTGGSGGRKFIDSRDLVLDFYANPRDPMRGASPVEAFALAHHMDIYMRAYGVKMIRDGAHVGQYVQLPAEGEPMSREEVEGVESHLNQKHRTPGRMMVLGSGAQLKHVQLPVKDLDMLRVLRPSRDQILGIYGVPPSKLGLTEGAGDTNQKLADKSYQQNNQLPRLTTFDEIMNDVVMPRIFGAQASGLFYESENPVEVDREWELEKSLGKFKAGAASVNQLLQDLGDEGLGTDGDVYFVPSTVQVVKSLAELANANAKPPETNSERLAGSAARLASLAGSSKPRARQLDAEVVRLRRAFAIESFLRAQDREERSLKSDVRSVFSREQRELKKAIRESESLLQFDIRNIPDAETRDDLDDVMRATEAEWNRVLSTAITKSTRTGWELLQQEVAGALDFSVFERKAAEFAQRTAATKVRGIQDLSISKVRGVITAGVEEGLSVNQISSRLDRLYDQFRGTRAEVIARTETATAVNYGKFNAAAESKRRLGMDIKRSWLATNDERTRDTHWAADADRNAGNKDIDVDALYVVGGSSLKHPGDPSGPAEEVIQCRCHPGWTDIVAGTVQAVFRRPYRGPLVEIETASGYKLSGTPNHPIATAEGWVPIGLLSSGDYVVSRRRRNSLTQRANYKNDVPATIRQMFASSALARGIQRHAGQPDDFHGDGADGYVDVVRLFHPMEARQGSGILQQLEQVEFARSGSGIVRRSDLRAPLAARHPAPLEALSGGLPSYGSVGSHKESPDHIAVDSEFTGNGIFRDSRLIETDRLLRDIAMSVGEDARQGFGLRTDGNAPLTEPSGNSSHAFVQPLGDGGHREPAFVQLDRVVKVRLWERRSGLDVFTLETPSHVYFANGIVAHNCVETFRDAAFD